SPRGQAMDPVCGMPVDPATAPASTVYQGRTYYFCCPHCLQKFEAEPKRYLESARPAPAPATPAVAGTVYTCPMDPEVRQDHPGACPKCGMALEPEVAPAPVTKTEYFCPMHPEVVSDRPGNCPQLVMDLETSPGPV